MTLGALQDCPHPQDEIRVYKGEPYCGVCGRSFLYPPGKKVPKPKDTQPA
jgi:hypothetical protein